MTVAYVKPYVCQDWIGMTERSRGGAVTAGATGASAAGVGAAGLLRSEDSSATASRKEDSAQASDAGSDSPENHRRVHDQEAYRDVDNAISNS
jgi:hypothetical protein